jgi:hypothetical protein
MTLVDGFARQSIGDALGAIDFHLGIHETRLKVSNSPSCQRCRRIGRRDFVVAEHVERANEGST